MKIAHSFRDYLDSKPYTRNIPSKIEEPQNKIDEYVYLFRGDSRESSEIFKYGFEAIDLQSPIIFQAETKDIKSESAVCLTPLFDMAALFPIQKREEQTNLPELRAKYLKFTNVYIVRLKKADLYLTYKKQIKCNSPLAFAQEVAVKKISNVDVVGKIALSRFFYVAEGEEYTAWKFGGQYILQEKEIEFNPDFSKDLTCKKLEAMIQKRQNIAIEFPIYTASRLPKKMSSIEEQHDFKSYNLDEHKLHKKLTKSAVLYSNISNYSYNPADIIAMLKYYQIKVDDLENTPFPIYANNQIKFDMLSTTHNLKILTFQKLINTRIFS